MIFKEISKENTMLKSAVKIRSYSIKFFLIVVKSPIRFIFFQLLKLTNLEQKTKTCYDTRVAYISQHSGVGISNIIFFKNFKITGTGLKSLDQMFSKIICPFRTYDLAIVKNSVDFMNCA